MTNTQGIFTFPRPPEADNSHFIISVKLSNKAALDHTISAGLNNIVFEDSQLVIASTDTQRIKQRIGVALRKAGDDNVTRYRIPGLARTNENTLLALYDVRRDSG